MSTEPVQHQSSLQRRLKYLGISFLSLLAAGFVGYYLICLLAFGSMIDPSIPEPDRSWIIARRFFLGDEMVPLPIGGVGCFAFLYLIAVCLQFLICAFLDSQPVKWLKPNLIICSLAILLAVTGLLLT